MLDWKSARSEDRERRLQQSRWCAVAGTPARAQRRDPAARDRIERLAVAMRVQQQFGATHEPGGLDRLARTEVALAGARRIGGG